MKALDWMSVCVYVRALGVAPSYAAMSLHVRPATRIRRFFLYLLLCSFLPVVVRVSFAVGDSLCAWSALFNLEA